MWWPESSLILDINQSKQYQKYLLGLYFWALYLLFMSSFAWVFQLVGLLCLSFYIYGLFRHGMPLKERILLVYAKDQWSWIALDKQIKHPIQEIRLLLKTGWFILLQLKDEHHQRLWVVFRDQMTPNQLKRMMWLLNFN